MKTLSLLVWLTLVLTLMGCQATLTDQQLDRIADRAAEQPMTAEDAEVFVNALLANPTYREALEYTDEDWAKFTNALLNHPSYQTTPEEDCAASVLMAVVMSGDYLALPGDAEMEEICDWYADQLN